VTGDLVTASATTDRDACALLGRGELYFNAGRLDRSPPPLPLRHERRRVGGLRADAPAPPWLAGKGGRPSAYCMRDVVDGGANLAASFRRQDLIDEYRFYVQPVILGAGNPLSGRTGFPPSASTTRLRLAETKTFGSGVVLLRYLRPGPVPRAQEPETRYTTLFVDNSIRQT
jgi:hypothetical protein